MNANTDRRRYWRKNLRYLGLLLGVWFIVSFGCGILFVTAILMMVVPALSTIHLRLIKGGH